MAQLSRPLIALLVSTVVFFALWTIALKPKGSSSSGGQQGLGAYSSAIAAAHHAAAASAAATAAESGSSQAPASQPTAATAASQAHPQDHPATGSTASEAHPATTSGQAHAGAAASTTSTSAVSAGHAGGEPGALRAALFAHRPVVVLFYNPASADDQAVKAELGAIRTPRSVFVLAAPIAQLATFSSLTEQVPVSQSPTLIFIDSHGQASEIVGFADTLQIERSLAATVSVG